MPFCYTLRVVTAFAGKQLSKPTGERLVNLAATRECELGTSVLHGVQALPQKGKETNLAW